MDLKTLNKKTDAKVCVVGIGLNANMLYYILTSSTEHEILMADPRYDLPHAGKYINGVTSFKFRKPTYDLIKELPLYSYQQRTSYVCTTTDIGDGTYIGPSAVIDYKTVLGKSCWVSRGATIGHDCKVGDNVFIGPGVTICGSVEIGDNCYIGAGAVIYDKISIDEQVIIRGGDVVK